MSKYSNHWFNLAAIALAAIVAGCGGGEQAAADAAADASIRRALATGGSSTGVDTIYSEAGKLVRAEETVDSLGNELFGEKVSLYNGALEFVQSDVSIQGNSSIPVSVARRLTTGTTLLAGGNFGDWDLEIPHVHGVFATTRGWTVGGVATGTEGQRCSQYGAPPQVLGQSNQGTFDPEEYWHGSFLYVPGQGSKELLKRNAAVTVPSDGNTYPLTTSNQWVIRCLSTVTGGTGEGFMAVSPDGTQYKFDWMVSRPYSTLSRSTPFPANISSASGPTSKALGLRQPAATSSSAVGATDNTGGTIKPPPEDLNAGYLLQRSEVWIMPTVITDRYGNTVTYTYDSAAPWRVTTITGSDVAGNPRVLTLSYVPGTNRISTVTDGVGRTWTYNYRSTLGGMVLGSVTRPDATAWTFNLDAMTMTSGLSTGGGTCDGDMSLDTSAKTGTITHPSGATGTFVVAGTQHGRSGVIRQCRGNVTDGDWSLYPLYTDTFSIQSKTISGPGMANATWAYSYGPANASFAPCNGCVQTKTVTVTDPRSVATRYTFGNLFRVNEGQLLQVDEGWNGTSAPRTTTSQFRGPAAGPYPDPIGTSPQLRTVGDLATRFAPQNYKSTVQQGTSFTWQANAFDTFARATSVTKSSSLGYSRIETTAYSDHLGKWILGQVASVTEAGSGKVMSQNLYDPVTANRTETRAFGLMTNQFTYYTNGTVYTKKDAGLHTTTFGAYKRGLPQSVTHPDSTSESVVINNIGRISSHTNAAATTTSYGYDAMGRLASITQPGGDPVTWNATTLVFEKVNAAEYGIAAGHWRQTVSTGNARTVRYFDGLWRERMTRTFDAANEGGTRSVIERRFDGVGNKVFESYPLRDITAVDGVISYTGAGGVTGKTTSYEPLGRVFQTIQSSELGALITTHSYLNGFLHQTSNPRGKVSTSSFQAFDVPSEDIIRSVIAPEGVNLAISRDVFGKPTAINRNGSYGGGTASATRAYVYDTYQRLCKTIEPETGATVQAYDAGNNLAWRASGLSLPSTSSCDQASAPAARKVSFGYDFRNRLTSTSYGDGSPGITRSYTADGMPFQVISAGSTWTYSYYNRRLLKQESLAYGGSTYAFDLGRDANGNVATQGYPGASVGYAPNALGQPTQMGAYASGVTYHPNGAMAGYTLANGVVHSVTQNTRGLPLVWRDAGVIQDQYTYDQNGNVTGITDQQEAGATSRSMGYDGLDRLTTANSPGIWGTGTFVYDPLDNVRVSTVGARTLTHNYDSTNRMTGVSGSINMTLGYDLNGNLNMRGPQAFNFDIGNRMSSATGKATYVYDGLGRRIKVNYTDGTSKLQIYSQAGKLLYSSHSTQGVTYHGYLGSQLIIEVNSITGNSYAHTDALGSPVARTGQTLGTPTRTRYEPYGATAGGTVPTGIGYTGHVNDSDTGLVYMQQRYYEPYAARFLSVDPVVTDAKTGGHFNRYVYAENNPYKYVDPNGEVAELVWMAADRATLTIRYTLSGVTSPVAAAAVNAQVAADFSGSANINGRTVNITAQGVNVAAPGPGVNTITVVTNTAGVTSSGRAETNQIGGSQITIGATGPNAANARTLSHELGHAAGAGDQYNGGVAANGTRLTADAPGPSNVMKDLSGQPANAQTLGEIIRAPTNTNSCARGVSAANGSC